MTDEISERFSTREDETGDRFSTQEDETSDRLSIREDETSITDFQHEKMKECISGYPFM